MSQSRTSLITDLWLRDVGFKPHFVTNPPAQHWLLWLDDDLGIELSFGREKPQPWYFCHLRTRGDHSPANFINLPDVSSKHEVITLVQVLTRRRWNPARHNHGQVISSRSGRLA